MKKIFLISFMCRIGNVFIPGNIFLEADKKEITRKNIVDLQEKLKNDVNVSNVTIMNIVEIKSEKKSKQKKEKLFE